MARRGPKLLWAVVVQQYPRGVAFYVVVLPGFEGPEECGKAKAPEDDRHRDENEEDVHTFRPTRSAFKSTVIEETDIATAASRGVA